MLIGLWGNGRSLVGVSLAVDHAPPHVLFQGRTPFRTNFDSSATPRAAAKAWTPIISPANPRPNKPDHQAGFHLGGQPGCGAAAGLFPDHEYDERG